MKNIRWKTFSEDEVCSKIGIISMHCLKHDGRKGQSKWCAFVALRGRIGMMRDGVKRKTLDEAKNDAVGFAKELLTDYHLCLLKEMERFGIDTKNLDD